MAGIVSYGGYVPILRMERKIIASAWGRGATAGERSIANSDEDSITMAVEGAINCLNKMDRKEIDGLYFASTTSSYAEKMNAALIAAAVDLERNVLTMDFTNSLRSSTAALRAALDAIAGKSAKKVVVTAADTRTAYPKSDQEQLFGDGAGAVLVGDDDVVADYEGGFAVSNDMMDVWRNPEDQFIKQWEGRFVLGEGYTRNMKEAVSGLMKKYNVQPGTVSKVILPAPDDRTLKGLAKSLGFTDAQIQDSLLGNVGHCGAAHPLMMLSQALEEAVPGDLLILAAYGDGADALLFKTTDKVGENRSRRTMKSLVENKMMFTSYARFLSYKNIVEALPGEPFRLLPSATATWRENKTSTRLYASKCRACGTAAYPIQRICYNCRSKDNYEELRLSDRTGTVYTFTRDNLAGRSDDPVLIQTVAEFEGNIRFYGLMTDFVAEETAVGMKVEPTFRRLYEGAGFHKYFWKLRPIK
jgi:hydroxymethylglutaryl-CoA synthase